MTQPSRRSFFLLGAAAAAASTTRLRAADEKVNVAVIGLGGRGRDHMNAWVTLPQARIVALCDIDQAALERGQAQVEKATGSKPAGYADMRRVFDDKNVHAVSMPLPNHWHSLSTIWACQAGKDVYVEKPACHNPWEGQKMIEAARKYGRIVQIGSQGRTQPHKIKAIDVLRQGAIGKVYLAKGLCFKRRPSIGHAENEPVPNGVNWDLFLGPAPNRPFNPLRFKYNWHWFWDTGNGDIGNQGVHEMDLARWGLGRQGLPKSVTSTGGKFIYTDDQETPNTQLASFDYGDAQLVFEVRGLPTGPEGGLPVRGGNTVGNLFYGSDGWMWVDSDSFQVYHGDKSQKVMDEKSSSKTDTADHMANFLAAVRSRKHTDLNADVEIGVTSADLCHLANISYRLKRSLKFDDAAHKFPGDDEANRLLTRDYRKPYLVPDRV